MRAAAAEAGALDRQRKDQPFRRGTTDRRAALPSPAPVARAHRAPPRVLSAPALCPAPSRAGALEHFPEAPRLQPAPCCALSRRAPRAPVIDRGAIDTSRRRSRERCRRSRDTTGGLTSRCTGQHRGARARAPRARVYAGLARAAGERRLVSERTQRARRPLACGDSRRRCASDRLVVGRSVVKLGVVGVAASGPHGGAVARPQPGHRGARQVSARSIGRRIQRRAVSGRAGGSLRRAVPRAMTYANIPLEPTRPASDLCAGLTAQRPR